MRQCPKCNKRFLESNARICDVDGSVLDLIVVASERDRLVGTTILGRYAVDGVLGDGGMGVVYRAQRHRSRRPYAVKVLRAEYSAEKKTSCSASSRRPARPRRINNPHIVEIYDWGSLPDNSRFFVMEYLEGRSLGDLLAAMPKPPGTDRREPLSEEFTIHLAMQICEGLGAAHAIGIVHRDIKPDNFHIVRTEADPYFVKILDFGIAKVQNSKAARTRTGSVFGTPHYMSPEQASGDRNIDARPTSTASGCCCTRWWSARCPSTPTTSWAS
jgi:serine/threonine protein kinase